MATFVARVLGPNLQLEANTCAEFQPITLHEGQDPHIAVGGPEIAESQLMLGPQNIRKSSHLPRFSAASAKRCQLSTVTDLLVTEVRYIRTVLGKQGLLQGIILLPLLALGTMSATGCERAPLECPAVNVGSLVVSEISGDKSDGGLGQWIELYNAGNTPVNLLGARFEFTTLNGGSTDEFTVRTALTVGAGDYVTFGAEDEDGAQPSHVDYVYSDDITGTLLTTAAAKVIVCGGEVDQVIYRDLPDVGSIALDGSMAPSAVRNDTEANFCADATGTPQMENQPCT